VHLGVHRALSDICSDVDVFLASGGRVRVAVWQRGSVAVGQRVAVAAWQCVEWPGCGMGIILSGLNVSIRAELAEIGSVWLSDICSDVDVFLASGGRVRVAVWQCGSVAVWQWANEWQWLRGSVWDGRGVAVRSF
jgi:hypothetical protein